MLEESYKATTVAGRLVPLLEDISTVFTKAAIANCFHVRSSRVLSLSAILQDLPFLIPVTMATRVRGYIPYMVAGIPRPHLEADEHPLSARPAVSGGKGEDKSKNLRGGQTYCNEDEECMDSTPHNTGDGTDQDVMSLSMGTLLLDGIGT